MIGNECCDSRSRPTYDDIQATSELIWSQMGGPTPAKHSSVYSAKMMTKMIWDLYKSRSVPLFRKQAILNQIQRKTPQDDAVKSIPAFLRGWASFNYPKYLVSLDRVVNYVLSKRGLSGYNYTYFAASCVFRRILPPIPGLTCHLRRLDQTHFSSEPGWQV
jgi:hypothetical protein